MLDIILQIKFPWKLVSKDMESRAQKEFKRLDSAYLTNPLLRSQSLEEIVLADRMEPLVAGLVLVSVWADDWYDNLFID